MKYVMNLFAGSLKFSPNPNGRTKGASLNFPLLTLAAGLMLAADAAEASNILVNPSFEANNGHVIPVGWTYYSPPTPPNYFGDYWVEGNVAAHSGTLYWKQWGALYNTAVTNVAGIYQDFSSAPGSAYQAGGWVFTRGNDVMGPDCFAWIEVSFLGASSNVLALYKSDNFKASVGTDAWFQYPVTNACDLSSPISIGDPYFTTYAVTGSVSQLVAPLGTTKIRYRLAYAQAGNQGGSCYFDDVVLNQISGPVAPGIWVQPLSQTVPVGTTNATFSVVGAGSSTLSYQWRFNGADINGASGTNYNIAIVSTNNAGNYTVVITNSYGSVTSSVAVLVVEYPPYITAQPASQTVNFSETVLFSVQAAGLPAPSFQWSFNGTNIASATNSTFTLQQAKQKDLGLYSVFVSNLIGTATSDSAVLSMHPFLSSPFAGVIAVWGRDAILSATAGGTGPFTYQWYMNGAAITDATNQTLTLPSIQFTNAGLYSLVVTSPFGSATNAPAQVVVNPADLSLGLYPGLTIGGVVGYSYIIQSAPNLSATNIWVTMTNLTLQQTQQLWIDSSINTSDPANPRRFYRVEPQQ